MRMCIYVRDENAFAAAHPDLALQRDGENWFHAPTVPWRTCPEGLQQHVARVIVTGNFSHRGITREIGRYLFCEDDPDLGSLVLNESYGGKIEGGHYIPFVDASTVEVADALYEAIRVGSFNDGRPFRPTLSYEGRQGGLSREELEAKVSKLQEELSTANNLRAEVIIGLEKLGKLNMESLKLERSFRQKLWGVRKDLIYIRNCLVFSRIPMWVKRRWIVILEEDLRVLG